MTDFERGVWDISLKSSIFHSFIIWHVSGAGNNANINTIQIISIQQELMDRHNTVK